MTYVARKKSKRVSFEGKWMELNIIILNQIKKIQKDKH